MFDSITGEHISVNEGWRRELERLYSQQSQCSDMDEAYYKFRFTCAPDSISEVMTMLPEVADSVLGINIMSFYYSYESKTGVVEFKLI